VTSNSRLGGPVVVGANWYRFASGERIINPHVMSVSFVWIVSGSGEIRVNGHRFLVDTQNVLRLPWNHRVEYGASSRGPFHIGTLHVVPNHDRFSEVVPRVAFQPGDPLLHHESRRHDSVTFLPSLSSTVDPTARRITEFGKIAIERFGDSEFDEEYFRALGSLVMIENRVWTFNLRRASLPGPLELMMTFIRHHIAEPLTVSKVSEAARCSTSTAQRLFRTHTGQPMQAWIRGLRMQESASLLRSSGMRVGEVARLVGYTDPLYFSRAFRREYGVSPSRFVSGMIRP